MFIALVALSSWTLGVGVIHLIAESEQEIVTVRKIGGK